MKTELSDFPTFLLCLCTIGLFDHAHGSDPLTSAYSETSPTYERRLLPSGRYERETYAFAKGVCLDNSGRDESLTRLSFLEIGNVLAEALWEADYAPTPSVEATDLLIVVHWGKTTPFRHATSNMGVENVVNAFDGMSLATGDGSVEDESGELQDSSAELSAAAFDPGRMEVGLVLQQMVDDDRRQVIWNHAQLLGYQDAVMRAWNLTQYDYRFRDSNLDVVREIEAPRYFVILQAYDFQKIWKSKEKEMLWTTRFSIRANRRNFDEELRSMALAASRVIGSDSKSLRRGLLKSRVEFGELEYLGVQERTD